MPDEPSQPWLSFPKPASTTAEKERGEVSTHSRARLHNCVAVQMKVEVEMGGGFSSKVTSATHKSTEKEECIFATLK